jgi:putative FmdB family regulatory protein
MPSYDFRCKQCRRKFTVAYATYDEVDRDTPHCPKCDSTDLSRLITRVGIAMGEDTRLERTADRFERMGFDEEDPRAIGRFMREMSAEAGEDLGPEFHEVVDRLESGESPESIEETLDGAEGGSFDMGDD